MFSPSEQTPVSDARGEKHAFQFGLLVYLIDQQISSVSLLASVLLDQPGCFGEAFKRTAKVLQKQQQRITIYFNLVVARGFLFFFACFPPELLLLLVMALDLDGLSISPCKMLYHLLGGW